MKEEKNVLYNTEKLYYSIKENLSLLVILPALIGGLWQVIELSTLSISFIRFFSVSQLVADGILILIVFLFFLLSIIIIPLYIHWVRPFSTDADKGDKNKKVDSEKNEDKSFVDQNPLISFAAFYGLIYLFFYGISTYSVNSVTDLIIYTLVGLWSILILRKNYLKERKNSVIYKKLVFLCSLFVFLTMFAYLAVFCRHIHNLFLLPKDLINVQIIKCNIRNEYPKDTIEILYTNDKYIFLEIKNQHSKILIIPFDDLVRTK